jgi:hypothetical protein
MPSITTMQLLGLPRQGSRRCRNIIWQAILVAAQHADLVDLLGLSSAPVVPPDAPQ